LTDGLTLEYWSRVKLTARLWQEIWISFYDFPPDSFHVGEGQPFSGRPTSLTIIVPNLEDSQGRRFASVHVPNGAGDVVPLPAVLQDGKWHRYRWLIYPSGELRVFADGAELIKPVVADLTPFRRATLAIAGRSVGTLAMVDDVTIWAGVVLDEPPRK
jgi:hypothetical protein